MSHLALRPRLLSIAVAFAAITAAATATAPALALPTPEGMPAASEVTPVLNYPNNAKWRRRARMCHRGGKCYKRAT